MAYKIDKIEGIGPGNASKLQSAGIITTDDLLNAAATPQGRKDLAEKAVFSTKAILKWANMADLMRIKGVGEEYSELLEAAGVDTVKELKMRRADNLTAKMAEVNETKKLVRQVPAQTVVEGWIEQAKSLEVKLTY